MLRADETPNCPPHWWVKIPDTDNWRCKKCGATQVIDPKRHDNPSRYSPNLKATNRGNKAQKYFYRGIMPEG